MKVLINYELLEKYAFDADGYAKNKKIALRYPFMKPMREWATIEQAVISYEAFEFFYETENGERKSHVEFNPIHRNFLKRP